MTLPENDQLAVPTLAAVFADTTNSYKFYWLLAILDSLREHGNARIPLRELSLRLVSAVWYPLDYFKLSFGKQDGFAPVVAFVADHLPVDNRPSASSVYQQLSARLSAGDLAQLQKRVDVLLNWVPYRFIRPFFASETRGLLDQKVNARIAELAATSNAAPYRFVGDAIEITTPWLLYLQQHQAVLRGFTCWHLVRFLQKHNPNVIGLSEKLEKPGVRVLNTAARFWKEYLTAHPGARCIYSGQPVTGANLSLDHFLPWSYVAHDQLWNIIPVPKSVNSAKSDWLPSLDKYFDLYARLQFDGFRFHVARGHTRLVEDYHVLFAQSLDALAEQPFEWFRERLAQQVTPQVQTARNLGFPYPFVFQ